MVVAFSHKALQDLNLGARPREKTYLCTCDLVHFGFVVTTVRIYLPRWEGVSEKREESNQAVRQAGGDR